MRVSVQGRFKLTEVLEITGVDELTVVGFVRREWISPVNAEEFDSEDVARIRLIQELRERFGANDEAIPLILHLLDQLYHLRHRIQKSGDEKK